MIKMPAKALALASRILNPRPGTFGVAADVSGFSGLGFHSGIEDLLLQRL